MPAATLEQIAVALFAKVPVVDYATSARTLRHYDDVVPSEQAALFQVLERAIAGGGAPTAGGRSSAGPSQWALHFAWYVYQHASQCAPGVLLESDMLARVDALRAALRPGSGTMSQTLGGLVADVRIAGEVELDGGALGGQGVAILPIIVLCHLSPN
jgi:hypothetical protein